MRICTITCHDVYNYGASLQAYALQQWLTEQGHDVRIIDYLPPYFSIATDPRAVFNPRYNRPVLRQLYLAAKYIERRRWIPRLQRFRHFKENYLHLTDRYASVKDLSANPPQADLFIAGSDQIWNTWRDTGRDPAFYLSFVPAGIPKIAYAASIASSSIHPDYTRLFSDAVRNLDSIGVRESSAVTIIEKTAGSRAEHVCDPVFLLDASHWNLLAGKAICDLPERYIAVYSCSDHEQIRDNAIRLSRTTSLPLVSLSPASYAHRDLHLSGPLEFLRVIRGASHVVTNSYHAVLFSLIFCHPFTVSLRSENLNARITDLLSLIGLRQDDGGNYTCTVDYIEKVRPILQAHILRSRTFLHSAMTI